MDDMRRYAAEALRQLWVFVVFPLLGGALAALTAPFVLQHGQRFRAEPEEPSAAGTR